MDDKNDQPLGSQAGGASQGKDVLYGWLVGRAAADLGLAQAIAASEAQRAEQIKRLEEALLGQMRELQNSQAISCAPSVDVAQVDGLKYQLQQFDDRQNFLEAQQLTISQIEAQLSAKLLELEGQIKQPRTSLADGDISGLRTEIAALTQRVAGTEASATRELVDEQIAVVVREQIAELTPQFLEQFQRKTSVASALKDLEISFQQKLDAMQQEIREKSALLRLRDAELSELRSQVAGVAQRLDQASIAPSANEREVERALLQRDFDERLTSRIRELGDEIRGKLHGVTSAKVDQEQFRGEILALIARIAQLEQSHQEVQSGAAAEALEASQAAAVLRGEMAEVKTILREQQRDEPSDAVLRRLAEMVRGEMQDLNKQVGQTQRATVAAENRFKEFRDEIQILIQRQSQAEAVVKQTHALVTEETAQIRSAVKADLSAMEAQLNERRARDAALQGMEGTLNLHLRELHDQLEQRSLASDQRDGELRDLKDQVQLLAQRLSERAQPSLPASAVVASAGTPGMQPADLGPKTFDRRADVVANVFQPVATGNGHTPDQFKIPPNDLHERLSAEIERKRAELREKSGRWKLRQ